MYLVDTGIIAAARRGDAKAVAWMRSVDPQTIFVSSLTLGEIMRAIAVKQTSDPEGARRLTEWLRTLRHHHSARILPVTDAIAVEWGRIAAGRPIAEIDGLIAATAIVHDLIVVTNRASDYEDTGADIIDPWTRR